MCHFIHFGLECPHVAFSREDSFRFQISKAAWLVASEMLYLFS
jgi:hypothetical protein